MHEISLLFLQQNFYQFGLVYNKFGSIHLISFDSTKFASIWVMKVRFTLNEQKPTNKKKLEIKTDFRYSASDESCNHRRER